MSDSTDERIEISESTITKIVSSLTALVPIALGIFQYLNDPNNLVGVLICVVLFISLVLWRMTQQQLREVKASYILLSNKFDAAAGRHIKYAQQMSNTATMMILQISRLSGDRDPGSLVLDPDTGATLYVPPTIVNPPPQMRRSTDIANTAVAA